MLDPWDTLETECSAILEKDQRTWDRAESEDVWERVSAGPISRGLYKFARRSLGKGDAARVVVTECVANLASRRQYSPQKGSLKSFVYAALRKRIASYLRAVTYGRDRRQVPLEEERELAAAAIDVPLSIDLQAAISRLDDRAQEVIKRSVLERQTSLEISLSLGITETNVRVIKHRAIRELRKSLGSYAFAVKKP